VDAINATGVEGEAQYRFNSLFDVKLAGDYTHATVDGGAAAPQLNGKRPAQTPRWTVTAAADWTVIKNVSLSFDVRYEDIRYADDQNTLVLPPGALVDLRLDWQATRNVGVYIAASNLADVALATDQTADHIRVYDEPRAIRFGFRLRG
jgi:outer membrane receptor protein involved in Fe transport